jgi:hypothetical protein
LKKISLVFLLIFSCVLFAQPKFSEISSMPGAFSRMGFGARGIGMGNAMSAVTEGSLVSYYNPALSVFQDGNSFQTSYTILSLDRSLNYLSFTRKFDFRFAGDTSSSEEPSSGAGLSIGLINSGVSNIDGRDGDGNKTGDLSTSEDQFYIGLANRLSRKLSIGIEAKVYYYKLYEQISSTGVGLDIGALYKVNRNWNISFVITDLNSSYKWDTSPIYQEQGSTTEDKFPVLKKFGVSYSKDGIITDVDFENSNAGTNIIRAGIEFNVFKDLYLRGGFDNWNISNSDFIVQPAFGFSYAKDFDGILLGVEYAFMTESYSPQDRHVIGINVNF